jgi:hypothetical protein
VCLNLFDDRNPPHIAESVISSGITRYVSLSFDIIKYVLTQINEKQPTHLNNIYQGLVAGATALNNQSYMTYLLSMQNEFKIDNSTVLAAVCTTDNMAFIRDIVDSLERVGTRDMTPGIIAGCDAKLDNVVAYLCKKVCDHKLTIDYEQCLAHAIKSKLYGSTLILLDALGETPRPLNPQVLFDHPHLDEYLHDKVIQKCREKNIPLETK